MTAEMEKIDPGAKGWEIANNRWHYFVAGRSLCGPYCMTAETAKVPYGGPRVDKECGVCLSEVNRRKM